MRTGARQRRPNSCASEPYWSYEDIGAFVVFVTLLGATIRLLVRVQVLPHSATGEPSAAIQFGVIALLSGALYMILKWRYHRAVIVPLGWVLPTLFYYMLSLLLGIASGCAVALYLHTGNQLFSHVAVDELLVGIAFGPILEESFFRGCLLPLLGQTTGNAAAIIITALTFALFHSPGDVQHWLCFTATGVVYGWLRVASRSTAASAIMHAFYNLALCLMAESLR